MAFQPGQSGNPSGRPKIKPFQDMLNRVLAREEGDPAQGKTSLERVVIKFVAKALEGDVPAIRDMADRLDGKPAQAIVGGGEGSDPVQVSLVELVAFNGDNEGES